MIKLAILGLAIVIPAAISGTIPITDPWFDITLCWWVFSAVTSGMPEPDQDSSFGYIWLYRTSHILSSQGTAYFAHRGQWPSLSAMKDAEKDSVETK